MSKQPYALWLADRFDDVGDWYEFDAKTWVPGAAAELRRLHSVNAELLVALAPFVGASLTHTGQVIGLMREDFDRARAAISLATPTADAAQG